MYVGVPFSESVSSWPFQKKLPEQDNSKKIIVLTHYLSKLLVFEFLILFKNHPQNMKQFIEDNLQWN